MSKIKNVFVVIIGYALVIKAFLSGDSFESQDRGYHGF